MKITINSFDCLKWYGRHLDYEQTRFFDYSASGFEFCFTGKKASAVILSDPERFADTNKGVIGVYVSELSSPADYKGESLWDYFPEDISQRFVLTEKENNLVLFESPVEKTVLIRVLKLSEVNFGAAGLKQLEVDGNFVGVVNATCSIANACSTKTPNIEIIGDSITCGYGIEGVWEKDTFTTSQQRADKAYAFLTAKILGAAFQLCSWSGIGIISKYVDPSVEIPDTTVVMPSVWPYTDKSLSLRLGIEPEIWDENNFSPDIVVVHLGTNDASFVRKVEERRLAYVSGLRQFLEAIHRRSPKAKICCCLGVMGQDLCDSVAEAVKLFNKDFSKVPTKVVKFPVQLESDGIAADWHPSAITHKKVAQQLAAELKDWC